MRQTFLPVFSKTCEYAFRATVELARASWAGERLTMPVVAQRIGAPKAFTAKVLQDLARAGIILSQRGPNGGFDLPPAHARRINLRMVMDAVGGGPEDNACVMGLGDCRASDPCPMHHSFERIKQELGRVLDTTYVHGFVQALEQGAEYKTLAVKRQGQTEN